MTTERPQTIVEFQVGTRKALRQGETFPDILYDLKNNHLARLTLLGGEKMVSLKAISGNYVGPDVDMDGIHFLIMPSLKDEEEAGIGAKDTKITSLSDLSVIHLSQTLRVAGETARSALRVLGTKQVNIGLHYHSDEWQPIAEFPKQKVQNFKPLHIHVHTPKYEGKKRIEKGQLRRSPEYAGKSGEPFESLGEGLFIYEILPKLKNDGVWVNELFKEVFDQQGRVRIKLLNGSSSFGDERLAHFFQAVHKEGMEKYRQVAGLFFEADSNSASGFLEDTGFLKRYKLLPRDQRVEKVNQYISKRSWLKKSTTTLLKFMAQNALTAENVIFDHTGESVKDSNDLLGNSKLKIKEVAARLMAFRGFSYAAILTGSVKEDGETEWTIGFRPSVFLVEGFVQMIENYYPIVVKNHENNAMTPEELAMLQTKEREIIELCKSSIPELQNGPGLINGT